jgi:uncharacterized membrane protein
MDGDHFLASVIAYTLTKLAIRASRAESVDVGARNRFGAEVILNLAQLLRLGASKAVARPMESDSRTRIVLCVNALAKEDHPARAVFIGGDSRKSFAKLLEEQARQQQRAAEASGSAG